MAGDDKEGSEPLKAVTAAVGLLAGVVAIVYVVGGVVIALRLFIDGFERNSVATILGQLPRELVVSTALLGVALPAAVGGLVAIGIVELWREMTKVPSKEKGKTPGDAANTRREVVVLGVLGLALIVLAGWRILADSFSLVALLALILSWGFTLLLLSISWHEIKRFADARPGLRIGAVGAFGALATVIPALVLAAGVDFEHAQVCTGAGQAPETGRLIGQGGGQLLLATGFGHEQSVVSIPSSEVTKVEYGDLSSTLVCPLPPGQQAAAKAAEASLGGHGSAAEVELAMALRPRLRFDSRESWRPIAVDQFVAEHFPGGGSEQACSIGPPRCEPLHGLDQLRRGPQAAAYIEIEGSPGNVASYHSPRRLCRQGAALDCNEGRAAVIYYRRTSHEGHWYWDYWWFYRYNDYVGHFNDCVFYCADHEGDWEGITVITTPALKPEIIGAIYAAHKDRVRVEGSMLPLSGGHPLAFVAEGTHATYPYRCATDSCEQYGTKAGIRLPEDRFDGEISWGGNDDAECAADRCVRPLPEVGQPEDTAIPLAGEWAAWPGKWGSTCVEGCDAAESSPNSPGLQIRFECPWAPTRWARLAPDGTVDSSEPAGDAERLRALCEAQRGGE